MTELAWPLVVLVAVALLYRAFRLHRLDANEYRSLKAQLDLVDGDAKDRHDALSSKVDKLQTDLEQAENAYALRKR